MVLHKKTDIYHRVWIIKIIQIIQLKWMLNYFSTSNLTTECYFIET